MRDTIALVLALALPPRPTIERVPAFIQPFAPIPVAVRREEEEPENFTTCHESAAGSCWTEN